MGKNQDPDPGTGSGMNNPGQISESLETNFWVKNTVLKFFDADPGSRIQNPFDPGSGTQGGKKPDPG
jgi:hypothetical protein